MQGDLRAMQGDLPAPEDPVGAATDREHDTPTVRHEAAAIQFTSKKGKMTDVVPALQESATAIEEAFANVGESPPPYLSSMKSTTAQLNTFVNWPGRLVLDRGVGSNRITSFLLRASLDTLKISELHYRSCAQQADHISKSRVQQFQERFAADPTERNRIDFCQDMEQQISHDKSALFSPASHHAQQALEREKSNLSLLLNEYCKGDGPDAKLAALLHFARKATRDDLLASADGAFPGDWAAHALEWSLAAFDCANLATPVAAVLGYAELTLRAGVGDDDVHRDRVARHRAESQDFLQHMHAHNEKKRKEREW